MRKGRIAVAAAGRSVVADICASLMFGDCTTLIRAAAGRTRQMPWSSPWPR
jgi:hypothetical protein